MEPPAPSSHDQPTVQQTPSSGGAAARDAAGPLPLARLGEYEILREIARGGMGVVYQARHIRLNRLVALKMIRGGEFADDDDRQRFDTEASAIAQLQHPNIVALYDVGMHDGQPYLAMEFIDGVSLSQRVALGPIASRRAAGYLEEMARAVHFAHGRGILHRDLKPANVLIDEQGNPKLTDFGLAKWMGVGSSGQTRTGAVLGTPSYMSPEQAAGRKDLGPASDVYSLGAILYELLTGHPPFQGETPIATLNQVAQKDPLPPRLVNPSVEREVETICLKCLEKDPRRRYGSAADLADDLRRYLDGEPIAARRSDVLQRSWKWVQRNPTFASVTALSLLSLISFVLILWQMATHERHLREREEGLRKEEMKQRESAERRQEALRHLVYNAAIRRAQQALEQGDMNRVGKLLHEDLVHSERSDLRDWEWDFLAHRIGKPKSIAAHAGRVTAVRIIGSGLVSAGEGADQSHEVKFTKLLDLPPWKSQSLVKREEPITAIVHSRQRLLLAFVGYGPTIQLLDEKSRKQIVSWKGHDKHVTCAAISARGEWLATAAGDGSLKVWRLPKDLTQTPNDPVTVLAPGGEKIQAVAFDPENAWLVAAGTDREIRFWTLGSWTPLKTYRGHQGEIASLAVLPGEDVLVSAGGNGPGQGEIRFWDLKANKEKTRRTALSDKILALAVSRDNLIAAGGSDGVIRIWNFKESTEATEFRGDPHRIYSLSFSMFGPDVLFAGGHQGRINCWSPTGRVESVWSQTNYKMEDLAFDRDSARCAALGVAQGPSSSVFRWLGPFRGFVIPANAVNPPEVLQGFTQTVTRIAYVGDVLVTAGDRGEILCFGSDSNLPVKKLVSPVNRILALAGHPRLPILAAGGEDEKIYLWNVRTGEAYPPLIGHKLGISALAFRPDGKQLAAGDQEGTLRLWDWENRTSGRLEKHQGSITSLSYSPGGTQLASSSKDLTIRLWDLRSNDFRVLERSTEAVTCLAFHPKSERRLVSCGRDRTLRLWDLVTGQALLEFEDRHGSLQAVAFNADGRWLASAGQKGVKFYFAGTRE